MSEKKVVIFSKDQGRYLSKKLRDALVSKFGAENIGQVVVSDGNKQISIEADLSSQQWTAVSLKLNTEGFKPDFDFNFS